MVLLHFSKRVFSVEVGSGGGEEGVRRGREGSKGKDAPLSLAKNPAVIWHVIVLNGM